jgi:hypothetical protein
MFCVSAAILARWLHEEDVAQPIIEEAVKRSCSVEISPPSRSGLTVFRSSYSCRVPHHRTPLLPPAPRQVAFFFSRQSVVAGSMIANAAAQQQYTG